MRCAAASTEPQGGTARVALPSQLDASSFTLTAGRQFLHAHSWAPVPSRSQVRGVNSIERWRAPHHRDGRGRTHGRR